MLNYMLTLEALSNSLERVIHDAKQKESVQQLFYEAGIWYKFDGVLCKPPEEYAEPYKPFMMVPYHLKCLRKIVSYKLNKLRMK